MAETAQTTDSAHPGQVQVATHAATYDAGDRVATKTDNGLTTVYGYDVQGQQRVATVQDGQTAIATARDAEGRVTSIVEGDPYTSNFGYTSNDQLQTVSLPDGVQQTMQYRRHRRHRPLHLRRDARQRTDGDGVHQLLE